MSPLDPSDPRQARARDLLRPRLAGRMGSLLSTECVFDEGMTLIRIRKKSRPLLERFHQFFRGPSTHPPRPFGVLSATEDKYRDAGRFHIQHFNQDPSPPIAR